MIVSIFHSRRNEFKSLKIKNKKSIKVKDKYEVHVDETLVNHCFMESTWQNKKGKNPHFKPGWIKLVEGTCRKWTCSSKKGLFCKTQQCLVGADVRIQCHSLGQPLAQWKKVSADGWIFLSSLNRIFGTELPLLHNIFQSACLFSTSSFLCSKWSANLKNTNILLFYAYPFPLHTQTHHKKMDARKSFHGKLRLRKKYS